MAKKKNSQPKVRRWLYVTLTIVFVVLIGIGAGIGYFAVKYRTVIIPGIKLANKPLVGLTKDEVAEIIEIYHQQIYTDGFVFSYQNTTVAVRPSIISATDPDLSYNIISIDNVSTADQAFQYGHRNNFWRNIADFIQAVTFGIEIEPQYEIDKTEMIKIVSDSFSKYDSPALNPTIAIADQDSFSVQPENNGEVLNYDSSVEQVAEMIESLDNRTITLSKKPDQPTISLTETDSAQKHLQSILNNQLPLLFAYEDYLWAVGVEQLNNWFEFKKTENNNVVLGFNEITVSEYLNTVPGVDINIDPQEEKFNLENGRVTEFQISKNGRKIDLDSTLQMMQQDFLINPGSNTTIATEVLNPQSVSDNSNDLGIIELVGQGSTNFRGSPRNRVHNITVGADTLNGLLIKPGEEFSLVKALGDIDASTGYLPELVIKGNRTIPEYGGGLCQIGTTFFRVVLDSGLPVLARQNHSYRVSYYEPPVGMDATIYNPNPDFKFKNDFEHYLLLQTRIEGTELIFELYGTKDDRIATTTEPRVYNYVTPGPTQYVETEDLAPGETKCTEKAHTGADAEFTYTVEYADGQIESTEFKSHYKAWPEVCLIGQEPEEETASENGAEDSEESAELETEDPATETTE